MTLILDVGCGEHPLNRNKTLRVDVDREILNIDVVGDAHNLPFRNSCFSMVHASMLLEHLTDPLKALSEFHRVSDKLLVRVPDGRRKLCENDSTHLYSWNEATLKHLLNRVYSHVEIQLRNKFRRWRYLLFCLFIRDSHLEAYCSK